MGRRIRKIQGNGGKDAVSRGRVQLLRLVFRRRDGAGAQLGLFRSTSETEFAFASPTSLTRNPTQSRVGVIQEYSNGNE